MGEQTQKGDWVTSSWLNQLTWLIKYLTLWWRGIIGITGVIPFLLGLNEQASRDANIEKDNFGRTLSPVHCFCAGESTSAALIRQVNKIDNGDRHGKFTFLRRSKVTPTMRRKWLVIPYT